MNIHTIKRCLSALLSCTVLAMGMTAAPLSTTMAANIIKNSTFESNASGWGIYKESGGSGFVFVEDGKLALNVTSLGSVSHAVQLYYDIIPLYQNGVYRLSYDISSSSPRYVEGMIQQNGGDYTAYVWDGINLTTTPQTIVHEFTMEYETDIMAKLCFNCGTQKNTEDIEHTIYLDNVSLELVDDSNVDYEEIGPYEPDIMTNQVGYKPESEKIAVFRDVTSETEFSVVNADTSAVVYTGELYGQTQNSGADETDYFGDFSAVTQPGTYYITCGALDDSYTFNIEENPYGELLDDTVKMLYLQRCGCQVVDSEFGHPACHTSMATVYGTNETIDVSGGWHDAGDYGRYVVPAAKTVADLLYAYDQAPELYGDNLGIPESGNGIPDVLDEVRYELEWMLKMQAESGGVYHKVSCATFPGYVMPQYETGKLLVTPVSTTATADFCASMAMAYEFYKDIDKTFADTCLAAAEKAWSFLEANTSLIFVNPSDIVTGEYGDKNDNDERYWATAQMYRATGDETYLTKLESLTARTGLDWSTVGDYGNIAILTMEGIDTGSSVYTNALSAVKSQADKFVTATESSPYGVALTKFNWGSNMTVSNAGIILGLMYQVTGEEAYNLAAQDNLNYLLGKNPNGVCYVTGYGTVSPLFPHHRPSMAVGKSMKGMLVGGVNSNLEDSAAKAYLANTPAAKCYVDNAESYSTNEITIYWNSPLTYLLSLTETAPEEAVEGDVNTDGKFNVADLAAMNYWLLQRMGPDDNEEWYIIDWQAADLCKDNQIDVFDMIAMRSKITKVL